MEKSIKDKFTELVKKEGFDNELFTFEYCSNYDCSLADNTIDKIEVSIDGDVRFYYNQNTNDYDRIERFDDADLEEFYNELVEAIEEEREYQEQENSGEGTDAW